MDNALKARGQKINDLQQSRYTDEDLLVRYCDTGERDLFAQLVQRYERELFSYLRRYLGDTQMAEDAFQTTFLQVHLKCGLFEEGRRFRPWLYTIATHQAIDAQRRNRRRKMVSLDGTGNGDDNDAATLVNLLASNETDPLERVSEQERGQWVRKSVEQLPESMQAAINLVYYQGMKYREAAEILSVPVGTIKSRLHAAVAKLNEIWRQSHAEHT